MIISCTCWIFIFLFCGLLEFFLHGQQGLRWDQQDKLTVRISFKDVFGVWGNWNCVWNGILILSQMMETLAICSWTFLFHLCSYFGLQTKHVGNFFRWSKMFFIVNYHTSEFCHSSKKNSRESQGWMLVIMCVSCSECFWGFGWNVWLFKDIVKY